MSVISFIAYLYSSDYGDYLYNGELWYGIQTTYKKAIRSITPGLSSVKATQKGDILVVKEKIKNKEYGKGMVIAWLWPFHCTAEVTGIRAAKY